MSAGYQLSRTAEDELEEILLYVADQSGGDRVRWWRVFDWVVLYDWESSPLTILRVLHGARDLDRLLNPDLSSQS